MNRDIDRILFTEAEINAKCRELGAQITQDYLSNQETPLLVALLKGSIPFLADLMKYIDLPIKFDCMDVSSYDGAESIGDIRILKDLDYSLKNVSVLLVEDIVDTGRTLHEIKKLLYNKGAKDVKVVTLLDKPSRRVVEMQPDYQGFEIENEFVVGYGLDYNQLYRNLPYVGILKRSVYE